MRATERLLIRRFAPGDLADFLAYQSDPVVRRYLPGEPMTAEAAGAYFAAQALLDDHAVGAWHGFAVEHVEGGRMIGDLGVYLQVDPSGIGDVGFQFHPNTHGQGYATEAVTAFLHYTFATLDLTTVTAACDPENRASWRLMERVGMHRVPETALQYRLDRVEWVEHLGSQP